MSPHYDHQFVTPDPALKGSEADARRSEDAMDDAAQALRHAEVESVQTNGSASDPRQSESLRPRNAK